MKSLKKQDIDKILGEIFKKYRINSGLTQEKIAEKLGISVKYISRIENGIGGVKVETLVKYMNILNISPNIIFEKLIISKDLKKQMYLSKKASSLSDRQIDFVIAMIDLLEAL